MRMRKAACALVVAALSVVGRALSGPPAAADELMDMSLEDLAAYKITSVSKKAEALQGSAAAVYVITREDMERSGYTSIAEALRMVPGMQVARVNAHDWDIGARGFNSGFSNKLLVLIDGRSVYSPLFSGVFWELRDVPVEDIERIEVIRGPGAALWGANAVNGVINVITRAAVDAHGVTARAGGGNEERAQGLVRYGGQISENADARVTASGFQRDGGFRRGAPDDDWWLARLQGRIDWSPSERDQVLLTAEGFGSEVDQERPRFSVVDPFALPDPEQGHRKGANALARWEHELAGDDDLTFQAWYEYTDLEFTIVRELRHTADLDAQHHFRLGERNDVVWGAAYRFSYDEEHARSTTAFDPTHRGVHLVTGFLHDQIALWPERVLLTVGSKLEYNEFTQVEVQPSARIAYTPNQTNTLWAAASRAVRTPTRLDEDADLGLAVVPAGFPTEFSDPTRPTLLVLRGNRRFRAEDALTFEAGYRTHPHADVSLDVAGFYTDYEDLATAERGIAETVPAFGATPEYVVLPLVLTNELSGESYGAEVAAWWQVFPWWRLHASYAYLEIELDTESGHSDLSQAESQERLSPIHQAFARSSFDLPYGFELDGMLRYVDDLPAVDVDRYVELDVRLGWRFSDGWDVGVVGQNLLRSHHEEAGGTLATQVQRGVYGYLRWRWRGE
jgi:iron complex outermembrane receptor protein